MAIYAHTIMGVPVKTGDLICTVDGDKKDILGKFWRFIGSIIPGKVDHIVVYIGPGGRCVEAAAKARVVEFTMPDGPWDAHRMTRQRGPIIDIFYGIAYPLADRNLSEAKENSIREAVAQYCLKQARLKKPYNLNFLDSSTDKAFYCSQLAYKAYLPHGIDLNTQTGVPQIPGTESIIYPSEIWEGLPHKRP